MRNAVSWLCGKERVGCLRIARFAYYKPALEVALRYLSDLASAGGITLSPIRKGFLF
jgi:hypothetical protein